jgi:hypothetical protein
MAVAVRSTKAAPGATEASGVAFARGLDFVFIRGRVGLVGFYYFSVSIYNKIKILKEIIRKL